MSQNEYWVLYNYFDMNQMRTGCYTIILIWVRWVLGVIQLFWYELDGYWALYIYFDMSQMGTRCYTFFLYESDGYWVLYNFFDMS